MATTFNIKQGDLLPSVEATLTDASGAAINLTSAVSVTFRMWRQRPGEVAYVVSRAATVVSAAAGTVRFDWQSGDTTEIGVFSADFLVMWPSSKPQTIPTVGNLVVNVLDGGLVG